MCSSIDVSGTSIPQYHSMWKAHHRPSPHLFPSLLFFPPPTRTAPTLRAFLRRHPRPNHSFPLPPTRHDNTVPNSSHNSNSNSNFQSQVPVTAPPQSAPTIITPHQTHPLVAKPRDTARTHTTCARRDAVPWSTMRQDGGLRDVTHRSRSSATARADRDECMNRGTKERKRRQKGR